MKKVGMLNSQIYDNYGSVLVAYALQEVIDRTDDFYAESIEYNLSLIKKINYKSAVTDYIKAYGFISFIGKSVAIIFEKCQSKCTRFKKIIIKKKTDSTSKEKQKIYAKKFKEFRETYLNRSDFYKNLTPENHPDYDVYLVGGDVGWGPNKIYFKGTPVFLDFTENIDCRRISYSVSMSENPYVFVRKNALKKIYINGLKKFDMISVREAKSREFLSDLCNRKVYNCIDPTLLLEANDYDKLLNQTSSGEDSCEKEYIYTYLLSTIGRISKISDKSFVAKILNLASEKLKLPIVGNCYNGMEKVVEDIKIHEEDGPLDFIRRIKNADIIITNSFHAVAFSIIFRKNFWVVPRKKTIYKVKSQLEHFNLSDRCIETISPDFDFAKPIDYNKVKKSLEEWKSSSMAYLKTALRGEE